VDNRDRLIVEKEAVVGATRKGRAEGTVVPPDEVEAVVAATRVVGALIAESLASVEPPVTMPQFRVLVMAAEAPRNVSAVAEDLEVHPSNATRLCDRLVNAGLLDRRRASDDRRQVVLTLTAEGRRLVDTAMEFRRERVERAMGRMSPEERSTLAGAIAAFADAVLAEHARTE
jgi:DNA-binding MarR family transcriptional regulator